MTTQKAKREKMQSSNIKGNEWLCRHCNTLVDNSLQQCPQCHADRPEEVDAAVVDSTNEDVITRDNYANAEPLPKAKYTFREGVLVNAADIIFILGIFCAIGIIFAPMFITMEGVNLMMWAVCIAIVIFASTMILWALLRTVADISRMLRERGDNHVEGNQ